MDYGDMAEDYEDEEDIDDYSRYMGDDDYAAHEDDYEERNPKSSSSDSTESDGKSEKREHLLNVVRTSPFSKSRAAFLGTSGSDAGTHQGFDR